MKQTEVEWNYNILKWKLINQFIIIEYCNKDNTHWNVLWSNDLLNMWKIYYFPHTIINVPATVLNCSFSEE